VATWLRLRCGAGWDSVTPASRARAEVRLRRGRISLDEKLGSIVEVFRGEVRAEISAVSVDGTILDDSER
jgi:hypothetical protein